MSASVATQVPVPRLHLLAALAVGATAISFAAIFFRLASGAHPLVAAGLRLTIAATLLSWATLRALRAGKLRGATLRAGVLAGVFYGLHFGTWVASLRLTSVAASVTLVTATPLLLAVHGLLSGRDRPQQRHFAAIALALVGLALITSAQGAEQSALLGNALAIAGAAAMAGYMLVARRVGEAIDPLALTGVATAVGALFLGAVTGAAIAGGAEIGWPTPASVFWIAMSALIPQLIGHTALTWALRHTSPTAVGLATTAEPVLSTVLAALWLAEVPPLMVLVGGAITLGGVILGLRRSSAA